MKIKKIEIENYRNLDKLYIEFESLINYIVGENNLGKSNLLYCLNRLFNGKNFEKQDFMDEEKAINIKFTLMLNDDELGIFDDLVDPNETNCINIYACQEDSEEYIKFYHQETNEPISSNLIKKINIINYDSLRTPKNELDFSKSKGAGIFLNYIINHYIELKDSNSSYLKKTAVKSLEKYVANILQQLTVFDRFKVHPQVEEDVKSLLGRILVLRDNNNVAIPDTGYGVQFNMLIMLSIFERIIDFVKKNKEEKTFSTVLIFDEPEIHLHPYLQRTIIKDILAIAEGKDEKFNKLLKELFGIDEFKGQIIIVTHSPNIIESDYSRIIRLYKRGNLIQGISGASLNLNNTDKKQLEMQFEYVKEAVFSKAVIMVEGDSEFAALKIFAKKMNIDFDRLGISIIKAGSANSVVPLMSMFSSFGIQSVGVIDKDKETETQSDDFINRFYTESKCFDSEIVENLLNKNRADILQKILLEYDSRGTNRSIQQKKLNKIIRDFGYENISAEKDYKFEELNPEDGLYKVIYVAWFAINKGILLGKVIGNLLEKDDIPVCYQNAINKVKELAEINE